MGQYTEGQRLLGSDGKHYVVRNGVPVTDAQSPLVANPKLPGELTSQSLSNQRTTQEIRQAEATAGATTIKARAEAESARIKALQDKEAYAQSHVAEDPALVGLTGSDLLAKLPSDERPMIQGMIDGRMAPPTASALKDPKWQQRLKWANQVDPSFDESQWPARVKGRSAIVSGTLGKSQNALNTAIGHAASLIDLIPQVASHSALGTPLARPINAIENAWGREGSSTGIAQWDYNANQLANELEAAYTGGQGSEQGRERQLASLNPNMSAEQKQAVIHKALDLLASKVAANYAQYSWAFKDGKPTWDMLDPDARAALTKYAPDVLASHFAAPASSSPPPVAPPPAGSGNGPPPPTGATNNPLAPSSNGYDENPDPQSAAFWAGAARQGTPYRTALQQWQGDVKARGLVGQVPPPPDAYHKAAAYIRDHPNVPYQPFSSVTRTPVNPLNQATTDAAFSGPGVAIGHAANAFAASAPTALAGEQGARYNAVSSAEHPNWAMAGDVAGTVGGALATGKVLGAAAPRMGPFGRFLTKTPGRQALTGDMLFGAESGAGQNPDNPLLGAAGGAAAMGAGNVAGRYLLGPVIRGAAKGVNKAAGMFGAAPLDIPAPLDAGQNLLFKRGNPAIGDIRSNLQDAAGLNLPYSLADASPQLRTLAGSAVRKSPDVRALAESTITPRQMGQGERAIGLINQHLAPVGDVPTMQAQMLKQAQAQSKPLYEAAKSQPVPELTANPQLKEILDRPAAQSAIRKGYETALNNGEDVGTLTYATDPNGNPVQYGNPSWNVIHYARQALDQNGESAVRHALDKQIAGLNKGFKVADAKYSGILKGSDALQAGADATGIKVTPEAAQQSLGRFPNNAPQFQQGYASNLADQVERSRLSGDPYNTIYGSMGQQSKINSIFPQGAPTFGRARALEGDMSKTAYETLGGSPTAARHESDKLFDNPMANAGVELGIMAATGVPPKNLIMGGLRRAADARNLGFRGAKSKADQIGPMLLNTDPAAGLSTLDEIQRLALLRRGYVNQTGTMGGMFGSPLLGAPLIYGQNQ